MIDESSEFVKMDNFFEDVSNDSDVILGFPHHDSIIRNLEKVHASFGWTYSFSRRIEIIKKKAKR